MSDLRYFVFYCIPDRVCSQPRENGEHGHPMSVIPFYCPKMADRRRCGSFFRVLWDRRVILLPLNKFQKSDLMKSSLGIPLDMD